MAVNVGGMRTLYKGVNELFLEKHLVALEPISQFKEWFEEACNNPSIAEANAMCLATATKDGIPSVRVVLLKAFGKEGFEFYTNYNSRKGHELEENPLASLCFYWEPLKKQVRVEGTVMKLPVAKSEEYFHSRPRGSQIGALASAQSQVIESREALDAKLQLLSEEYADESKPIPKPSCWGGYLVVPKVIEFWQGQSNRVHDRIRFRKLDISEEALPEHCHLATDGWAYERLSP